jgi:hypothetical protein
MNITFALLTSGISSILRLLKSLVIIYIYYINVYTGHFREFGLGWASFCGTFTEM